MMLVLAVFLFTIPAHASDLPVIDTTIYTTQGEVPLKLEVAATPEAREHGLMERIRLAPFDGMLFLFPTDDDHRFWMKNTRLPLDMLFVGDDRSVAAVEADTAPYSLDLHHAGRPVRSVIELDGGRAAKDGIEPGDKVRYALPPSLDIR
jgi:hypothetical protein